MNIMDLNTDQFLANADRRLSEILRCDMLKLTTGGAASLSDPLWVWGVLGGKNVGKSTLIDALAGSPIVEHGDDVGEGTFQPAAYLNDADADALHARFAGLTSMPITYHNRAPDGARGLVLVDLPDFDSLFSNHVEQVRQFTGALDGIIWVTTPKKMGDLRAMNEIQRVLKDRANFVHVVNKMDWLLAQSDSAPLGELDRITAALRVQINECAGDPSPDPRFFMIAAKYRTTDAIIESITRSRTGAEGYAARNADLLNAATRLTDDFTSLKRALTAAPTSEAVAANKRANLTYQSRILAARLLDHYKPQPVLQRLTRIVDEAVVDEAVDRTFPGDYCEHLMRRMHAGPNTAGLFVEWSATLFKERIVHWTWLGIIAWPAVLAGLAFGGLRSVLAGSNRQSGDDAFRFDGLSLEERIDGAVAGTRAKLAGIARRITIELPDTSTLARQFRTDARTLAEEQRTAVLEPYLSSRPTALGRLVRASLPLAVLIWFPIAQPLLAGLLSVLHQGASLDIELALALVQSLSAANVLVGLSLSLLILCVLVAAVYSGAVRDSFAALHQLHGAAFETHGSIAASGPADVPAFDPPTLSLVDTLNRPIESARAELTDIITPLAQLIRSDAIS